MVEADADEVGNDAPMASWQCVEIVPTLLDGGSAIEPATVEVRVGVFEFDHRDR
jgi:hypothetical protein